MKKQYVLWNVFIVTFIILTYSAYADVKLPALFTDNMIIQRQMPVPVWGWAASNEKIAIQATWQKDKIEITADAGGCWKTQLNPIPLGQSYCLTVSGLTNSIEVKNILAGDIWICSGQSNMKFTVSQDSHAKTELPKASNPQIRLFTVGHCVADKPQNDCNGQWQICTPKTAADFSAAGYYFAKTIYEEIKIPIGLIDNSVGGTPAQAWINLDILKKDPNFQPLLKRFDDNCKVYPEKMNKYKKAIAEYNARPKDSKPARKPSLPVGPGHSSQPGGLYNGKLYPLFQANIKGVLWYQGEANTSYPQGYDKLFQALITDWRKQWRQENLPFLFVQLAATTGYGMGIAEIRESQLKTFRTIPNTGMVVAMDLGDRTNHGNHHPTEKLAVGQRLAKWALAETYGKKNVVCSGPLYRSMSIEGSKIRLQFDYVGGGLIAKGGELKDFTICGKDKVYHPAKAVIENDTVVVSSEDVSSPIGVRYAWCEYAEPNFYNKEGFPASPFRTDY